MPAGLHEKELQRALIQYRVPKNRALVREALKKAGREDLVGYGPGCLIRPEGRDCPLHTDTGNKKKKKTIRNVHRKKQER